MHVIKVGRFEFDVSAPYPCWVRIRYDGNEIGGIRHDELRDLEYGVSRAIHLAKQNLDAAGEKYGKEIG